MSDLSDLYAACMVEYAKRHKDGVLKGPFYTFGKDARDAFNLPYGETIFRDALNSLERIRALKRYKHAGVQTHYQLSASLFSSMMAETDEGKRRYTTFPVESDSIASASAFASLTAQIFPSVRRTSLLEAYADLGSDYLNEVLEAMEPELEKIGEIDEVEDGESAVENNSFVPASDRLVSLDHNLPEYKEISRGIADLREKVRGINSQDIDIEEKSRILAGLAGASALWEAAQLKVLQVKVGILMAVEDAENALSALFKDVGVALLIEAIKSFVKNHIDLDLDKM